MKIFERLYTLDSKGKVRVFDCRIEENTLQGELTGFDFVDYVIITSTGLLDGKLIEQKEKVKSGKQKRDIQEQAEFQAEALWKAKLDEGYKSFESLKMEWEKRYYNRPITIEKLQDIFLNIPEASYTNSNWDELPMLAHKWKDVKKPVFPYYLQPKLNGVRCLAKFEDITKPIKLISRGGTYYDIPHIQRELFDLFMIHRKYDGSKIILDGEIYKHGIPLQQISGAARTESTGLFNNNDWLEYHIYDIITEEPTAQGIRSLILDNLARVLRDQLSHIKILSTDIVENDDEITGFYEHYIKEGYEGVILRDPRGMYNCNQRSKSLLKVKLFQDEEFEIIGYECNPERIGESFVFVLRNNINNLTFEARPTGTEAMKLNWYKNSESWMNKKATVKFFERTVDGLPSHAHLMHKQSECLIIHIRPKDE